MFIKSTGKKNIIDLFSIKQQISRNQELPIKDDEYWNPDIQVALKMGWITASGAPVQRTDSGEVAFTEERVIECENIHHRSIALNQNAREIRSGQRFNLKESEIDTPAIRYAISNGMIKIISSVSHKSDFSEATVDIDSDDSNILDSMEDDNDDMVDVGLDTNEELSAPTVVEDNKGVMWNTKDDVRVAPVMTNVITDENPDPVDSNRDDPKGRSVVVDPNKARFLKYRSDENITFVDQEGESERIMKHPTMNPHAKKQAVSDVQHERRLQGENVEVDVNVMDAMVEDEDEVRRKAHPILGKEKSNPKDVDFLDDLDDLEIRVSQHPVLGKKDKEAEVEVDF